MNKWFSAFRLRTLPLAAASSIIGSALAYYNGYFSWSVALMAIITAISLQILSNLANDMGDFTKGTDNEDRVGPERAMQSGAITRGEMLDGLIAFSVISLLSGSILLWLSGLKLTIMLVFLLLGIAAIFAAIRYTVGDNAYGYSGFGDLFVFLFFGILSVAGTAILHMHKLEALLLLPAAAFGCLCIGVLNINNMRDIENDKASGKNTIPVRLGLGASKIYHTVIIVLAFGFAATHTYLTNGDGNQWMYLLAIPAFGFHLFKVFTTKTPQGLDPLLKQLALFSLAFALLFSFGLILI